MFHPADLLKLKGAWSAFTANHPKFPMFLKAVSQSGITEDTVIEVHVKYPTGEDICTNVKVTASDLELFEQLKTLIR